MSETGNSITASMGLDLAPLKRDFAQAEQIGKAGAAKVQNAMAQAAKAAPAGRSVNFDAIRREQQQIEQFFNTHSATGRRIRTARDFAPAPKGKYPSPAEQMGEDSGLGRRGLAGIGLLTAAHQLASIYKDAAEKAYNLRIENDKLLRPVSGSTGIDELRQRIQELSKASDDAHEQLLKDTGKGVGPVNKFLALNVKAAKLAMGTLQGQGGFGTQLGQEQSDREGFQKRAAQAVEFMADKQNELNKAEGEGRSGSRFTSELMKAEIEHRERLGKLAEIEAKAGVKGHPLEDAEVGRYRGVVDGLSRTNELKKQDLALEDKILGLQTGQLTKDQQSLAALQERIKLLKQRIADPKTGKEDRAEMQVQVKGLQNQAYREQYANRFDGPALYTPEKGEQSAFAEYIKNLAPSNPNAYKTHPDAYSRVRDAYGAPGESNLKPSMKPKGKDDADAKDALGHAGVLDRIEKNTAGLGANK